MPHLYNINIFQEFSEAWSSVMWCCKKLLGIKYCNPWPHCRGATLTYKHTTQHRIIYNTVFLCCLSICMSFIIIQRLPLICHPSFYCLSVIPPSSACNQCHICSLSACCLPDACLLYVCLPASHILSDCLLHLALCLQYVTSNDNPSTVNFVCPSIWLSCVHQLSFCSPSSLLVLAVSCFFAVCLLYNC